MEENSVCQESDNTFAEDSTQQQQQKSDKTSTCTELDPYLSSKMENSQQSNQIKDVKACQTTSEIEPGDIIMYIRNKDTVWSEANLKLMEKKNNNRNSQILKTETINEDKSPVSNQKKQQLVLSSQNLEIQKSNEQNLINKESQKVIKTELNNSLQQQKNNQDSLQELSFQNKPKNNSVCDIKKEVSEEKPIKKKLSLPTIKYKNKQWQKMCSFNPRIKKIYHKGDNQDYNQKNNIYSKQNSLLQSKQLTIATNFQDLTPMSIKSSLTSLNQSNITKSNIPKAQQRYSDINLHQKIIQNYKRPSLFNETSNFFIEPKNQAIFDYTSFNNNKSTPNLLFKTEKEMKNHFASPVKLPNKLNNINYLSTDHIDKFQKSNIIVPFMMDSILQQLQKENLKKKKNSTFGSNKVITLQCRFIEQLQQNFPKGNFSFKHLQNMISQCNEGRGCKDAKFILFPTYSDSSSEYDLYILDIKEKQMNYLKFFKNEIDQQETNASEKQFMLKILDLFQEEYEGQLSKQYQYEWQFIVKKVDFQTEKPKLSGFLVIQTIIDILKENKKSSSSQLQNLANLKLYIYDILQEIYTNIKY